MQEEQYEKQEREITLVTAFLDIGRDNWENNDFKRTTNFYINSFLTYLNYPYKMVCYIDEKYFEHVYKVYKKSPYQNKQFIPIHREWLDQNIHAWRQIEKDRNILNDPNFKKFLKGRLEFMYPEGIPEENEQRTYLCPENIYPEYNVINHSKIDFISHAIKNGFINTYYTAWSDFGYFSTYHKDGESLPTETIDTNKLDPNKITICLRREIIEDDKDMFFTLLFAYELFIGAFYAGPTHIMEGFKDIYHDCVEELYRNGISDDDQHVYIRCYMKNPDIFNLSIHRGDWPKALTYFQGEPMFPLKN
jgi:protein YibB